MNRSRGFNTFGARTLIVAALLQSTTGAPDLLPGPREKAQTGIYFTTSMFDLGEVRLRDYACQHAIGSDRHYQLSIETSRLLHNFYVNAGLPTTSEPLGGWEAPSGELRGHFVGHYLSACSMLYASTGDAQLKERVNAIVSTLTKCQTKLGDSGYLSAFPETFFDRLEARQQVWAPYYAIHKILAGLLDAHVYCGNEQALLIARKLGDWIITRNSGLSDAQLQNILNTEQGGIAEALANLSGLTGERKYLDMAKRFNHLAVLNPAMKGEDRLTGLHINTQIPKFIGAAKEYELTGDESLKSAALFFWNNVVKERTFVTGGMGSGEYFTRKDRLSESISAHNAESCNTYNMLKLTRYLFCWDPKAEYADYYERALYNHILASQDPETGYLCHFMPMQSGSQKTYIKPDNGLGCCTGTGIESQAKYGDSIYFHDGNKALFVNLFIASELNWQTNGMKIRQETKYPDDGITKLTFTCDQPKELSLNIRHPWWATAGFEIRVNGQRQEIASSPSSYAVIIRRWKTGDTVEVGMQFTLRTEGFADNPNIRAVMCGPLVLCAEIDPHKPLPSVATGEPQFLNDLKPVAGKPNTYTLSAEALHLTGYLPGTTLTLQPFYVFPGGHDYEIYWNFPASSSQ